jgi:two-component system sensor histidine kinase and response regulator WspE
VQGLPRLVRDLARQLGKNVQLEIQGETTEVDRDILEKLDAPLNHLVRNALDHGFETPAERQAAGKPETGRLRVEAAHSAGLLSITVADDGRGIDVEQVRRKIVERGLAGADIADKLSAAEVLEFLFLPGFSTATTVTEISGRGVGLDVVHARVQSVGGQVHIDSEPARGTTFRVQLPVTLSVLRAVVVKIAGEPYAFPHNRIDRLIRIARSELHSLENRQYFEVDGQNVGTVMARQVLRLEGPEEPGEDLLVVLFGDRKSRCGLVVDALLGEQDLVVRPLDRRLGKVPNLHAAAILDDGSPVLIVDPDDLRRSIEKLLQGGRLQRANESAAPAEERRPNRVLVVDDSITVREVERQLLANQGYLVEVAVDGMEGWNLVREGRFDLVVSDIDMPRLNGLELVRRIKADSRLQRLPVIIVSYKDRDEDRLLGLEAGANYYLTKSSFHDDTLIRAVRELIGNAEP